jgi:hypothetical protein
MTLQLEFAPNDDSFINDDQIGRIYYSYDNILRKLRNPEYVDLDYQPVEVTELSNKNILIASSNNEKFLELRDRDLKPIRRINQINGEDFKMFAIEPDSDGHVYATNYLSKSIYKLTSEFALINSYTQPNKHYYDGVSVFEDRLYACMPDLKRVEVFSLALELLESHQIKHKPSRIRITKDRACVVYLLEDYDDEDEGPSSGFYTLPDFEPVMEVDQLGAIIAHRDLFYMYMNKVISVYDGNGRLTDRRSIEINSSLDLCCSITIASGKFLICLRNKLGVLRTDN